MNIILFLTVKCTLCVLEGGWHESVTQSRDVRWFCVGCSGIYVRCFCGYA